LKLALGIALIYAAAALLTANSRAADDRPKKQEMDCGLAEKESGTGSADCQENSSQEEKKPSLWRAWLRMADKAQADQPDWLSPLATTSGRLKQELRFDTFDQPALGGSRMYQLGGNKGLELITSPRTQILVGVPGYILQSPKGPPGGFGDLPLMLKFRIASAERSEGNYLLTFLLSATAPTGSHRFGAGDATLTPTLAFGKGWSRFNTQSTFGINLPAGNTTKLGQQLQWNTAFQYQAAQLLWPELEMNSTFFTTGKNAGDKQVFVTPGLGFGRIRVGGRYRFSSAAGIQIAVTRFHTFNHRWIFSERLSF